MITIPIKGIRTAERLRVRLDGTTYQLRVEWRPRVASWYLSIALADGTELVSGKRLVPGYPVFRTAKDDRLPTGRLWVLDMTGTRADLVRDSWSSENARLVYLTTADIPEAAAETVGAAIYVLGPPAFVIG